jgi:hypothetical protein
MAAPSISWFRCRNTSTYSAITSLNFGTVTAGAWSVQQVIRPKVAVNSIQSAKWWFYDVAGVRSAASTGMGSAAGWLHYMTATSTYVTVSATSPKGSAGITAAWTQMPETTGSGVAYADVSDAAYGEFVYLTLKVPSAAGDGAHTAWGYQLKYSYT